MSPLGGVEPLALLGATMLVLAGAAIQVVTGAGLSVVCGFFLLLWLGPAISVPVLLWLNLLVSIAAAFADWKRACWRDVAVVSAAMVAGCAIAFLLPPFSSLALTLLTVLALVAVAAPRPPAPDRRLSAPAAGAIVATAGVLAGALTVWTATPGPIAAVALARAGRSGSAIPPTMQPISIVGYGAALVLGGTSPPGAMGGAAFLVLCAATLAGTAAGLVLRPRIQPRRIVIAVRMIAVVAAALLVVSTVATASDLRCG